MKIYDKRISIPYGFDEIETVKKLCYINVGNFAMHNDEEFKKLNMKIAYGFCNNPELGENLWFRHCFILYNNEILDITLDLDDVKRRYIVFKTFDNFDELVETNVFLEDTSLAKYLIKEERELIVPFLSKDMKSILKNYKHAQDVILLNI